MKKINEVIVVEGKNDTKKLKSFFDVETIETNGSHLSRETIEFIKRINATRGVILFLDPDSPGEKIRNKINSEIAGLKNAFLLKEDARTAKKVGIEHASKEVLEAALNNLVTYDDSKNTLTLQDYYGLGLNGQKDSEIKRAYLAKRLHIGKCNAKTMYKRLNMIMMDKEKINELLKEMEDGKGDIDNI